jgi:hypothetical protein
MAQNRWILLVLLATERLIPSECWHGSQFSLLFFHATSRQRI